MKADRAIVVGNGPAPSETLLAGLLSTGASLLCADGGANTVHELGHVPQAVVGDLDSVDADVRGAWPQTDWVCVDADDTGTDLQKVLRYAVEVGIRRAVLTGVTGGRTDHTLWNLSLLPAFADQLGLCVIDDHCLIRLVQGVVAFEAPKGLKLSLCPLAGPVEGISTRGLRWPLRNESLVGGQRDGISNEVVDEQIEIRVAGGQPLLLIIQREGVGADLGLIDGLL